MVSERKKPTGIVLIAINSAIGGAVSFWGGLTLMISSAFPDTPDWHSLFSIHPTLFGLLLIMSVYGLWTLQSWGVRLTFWLYLVSIPLGITAIFPILPGSKMSLENTLLQSFTIGISIAVILYLKKDLVQNLYKKRL